MIVVLMGVSGSGKTTIGVCLAERSGVSFADGDDFHPAANTAKMASGTPLTDEDRAPWLEALNALMLQWYAQCKGGVLACSALKEEYRSTLAHGLPSGAVAFVLLDAPPTVLAGRLAARHHEFMNPRLLGSQLATLEPPDEEGGLRVCNDKTPEDVVEEILRHVTPASDLPCDR